MAMWFFSNKRESANRVNRRVQARRSPVYTVHARATGRRNDHMHMAGAIALLVIALGGLAWLIMIGASSLQRVLFAQNEQFVIRRIEAVSSGRLTRDQIEKIGGFQEGLNLFGFDLKSVRRKLLDMPLIKGVELQRKVPSTLVVRVSERIPLARILQGPSGFSISVDRDAHVLGSADQSLRHLPSIAGFSDRGVAPGSVLTDAALIDALAFLCLVDEAKLGPELKVTSITLSKENYFNVKLESGLDIKMPRQLGRKRLDDLAVILRQSHPPRTFIDFTVERNIPAK